MRSKTPIWDRVIEEAERICGNKEDAAPWLYKTLGYEKQRVFNWGKRDIPPREYVNVAAALGKPLEWVATGVDVVDRERPVQAATLEPGYMLRLADAAMRLTPEEQVALLQFALNPKRRDKVGKSEAAVVKLPTRKPSGTRPISTWDAKNHPHRRSTDKTRRGK